MMSSTKVMPKPVRNVILWGLFAMTSALVIAVNTPVLWALSTCVLGLGLFLTWTEWYDNDVLNEIVAVVLVPAALYCALNADDVVRVISRLMILLFLSPVLALGLDTVLADLARRRRAAPTGAVAAVNKVNVANVVDTVDNPRPVEGGDILADPSGDNDLI